MSTSRLHVMSTMLPVPARPQQKMARNARPVFTTTQRGWAFDHFCSNPSKTRAAAATAAAAHDTPAPSWWCYTP